MRIASKPAWRLTRRGLMAAAGGAVLASGLPFRSAFAADKIVLRTNWLFYGSHAIFFLGIDRGMYEKNNLDVIVKQGNGSGNTVRLVANSLGLGHCRDSSSVAESHRPPG